MFKTGATLLTVSLALTACSDNKPPECFSPATKSLVVQALTELALKQGMKLAQSNDLQRIIEIRTPTPTAYEESIKRFTCEAELVVPSTLPATPNITQETDLVSFYVIHDPDLSNGLCQGESCEGMFKFTTQLVNDSHVVSVSDVSKRLLDAAALYAHLVAADRAAASKAQALAKQEAALPKCDDSALIDTVKTSALRLMIDKADKLLRDLDPRQTVPEAPPGYERGFVSSFALAEIQRDHYDGANKRLNCTAKLRSLRDQTLEFDVEYQAFLVDAWKGPKIESLTYVNIPETRDGYNLLYNLRQAMTAGPDQLPKPQH